MFEPGIAERHTSQRHPLHGYIHVSIAPNTHKRLSLRGCTHTLHQHTHTSDQRYNRAHILIDFVLNNRVRIVFAKLSLRIVTITGISSHYIFGINDNQLTLHFPPQRWCPYEAHLIQLHDGPHLEMRRNHRPRVSGRSGPSIRRQSGGVCASRNVFAYKLSGTSTNAVKFPRPAFDGGRGCGRC